MKTTILLLLLACVAVNAADYRIVDGEIYNLDKSRLWGSVQGEVIQVLPGGVVAQKVSEREIRDDPPPSRSSLAGGSIGGGGAYQQRGKLIGTEKVRGDKFYVANAPESMRTVGAELGLYAIRRGSTNLAGLVIAAYDRGTEATPEMVRNELAKRGSEATSRANALAEIERNRIAQGLPKLIAYQLTQASNGLPSFQIEVAKRYLSGDGLEKNMTLARHWLNSACTNRDSQASNLLLRLNSE